MLWSDTFCTVLDTESLTAFITLQAAPSTKGGKTNCPTCTITTGARCAGTCRGGQGKARIGCRWRKPGVLPCGRLSFLPATRCNSFEQVPICDSAGIWFTASYDGQVVSIMKIRKTYTATQLTENPGGAGRVEFLHWGPSGRDCTYLTSRYSGSQAPITSMKADKLQFK